MDSGLPRKVIGMSSADYFSQNDFDSRSFYVAVLKGGGPAQWWLDRGNKLFEGNNATRLGSKFDSLIQTLCEGGDIDSAIVTPPASVLDKAGRRSGGAYKEWRESQRPSVIDCNEDEAFQLRSMAENLLENPAARSLVEQTTETQVSVFFELNGNRVKVRPDGCTPAIWWDLKSTSATWDRLHRSVFDYGYAEQEWLYVEAAKAIGYEQHRMPFVFVQTMAPFCCHVFYLPEDVVSEAGKRMQRVMEEVRLRRSTGVYLPADHGEITELPIPQWAMRQEEEVVL